MVTKQTRQSGPEANKAPEGGGLHKLPPGGPIMPSKQGYENPGATPNLRGVEHNTSFHKGMPAEPAKGTGGKHGDHDARGQLEPPQSGPQIPRFPANTHSKVSTKMPPPVPNPKGVKK